MPAYRYVARDYEGRQQAGVIEAATEKEAREMLRNRDLYATELREDRRGLLQSGAHQGPATRAVLWGVLLALVGLVLYWLVAGLG